MDGNDITYTVDDLTNRYTSIEDANLTYNATGNLTKDKDSYEYEYDYENRIIRITRDPNDTIVAEFAYDALGRRIRKIDSVAGQTTLYYNNYKWQVLYEKNPTGNRIYVYGNYIDEVLFRAPLFYFIQDHLYSTVAVVNSYGSISERYEYDAYGNPTIWNGDFTVERSSPSYSPFLFTGREVDYLDSGSLKIQYNRNRYYDYYSGRWLTQDPRGYVEGMNLYEYCISQPMLGADPIGLFIIEFIGRPMWKENDVGCLDEAWASIVLFPTNRERKELEDNSDGNGTVVQDRMSRYRVYNCCGKYLKGGNEMMSFVNPFELDVGSDHATDPGGKFIVTGEWIPDPSNPGELRPWFPEERWAMSYVALIHRQLFSKKCCTRGNMWVKADFRVYQDHPLILDDEPFPDFPDMIAPEEYGHGKRLIAYGTTPPGLGLQIAKGGITVNISWDCDGHTSFIYFIDSDSPLDLSRLGRNTRRSREVDIMPGYHPGIWHPFSPLYGVYR